MYSPDSNGKLFVVLLLFLLICKSDQRKLFAKLYKNDAKPQKLVMDSWE